MSLAPGPFEIVVGMGAEAASDLAGLVVIFAGIESTDVGRALFVNDRPSEYSVKAFDRAAGDYDRLVTGTNTFPHAGYEEVLDTVVRLTAVEKGMRVLDLGVGTGNLTRRFLDLGCDVWGIDYSTKMLAQARKKVPEARLVQGSLLDRWPAEIDDRFDRIVSSYVLHHFDLETKIRLVSDIARRSLEPGGFFVIADMAFGSADEREAAKSRAGEGWEDDEFYWAADETRVALRRAGLTCAYEQVSWCGGAFVIKPQAR